MAAQVRFRCVVEDAKVFKVLVCLQVGSAFKNHHALLRMVKRQQKTQSVNGDKEA